MQNSLFEQRLENLKTVLDSNSQAVLLTNEKNIGYFCGFFHTEEFLEERTKKETEERRLIEEARAEKKRAKEVPVKQKRKRIVR